MTPAPGRRESETDEDAAADPDLVAAQYASGAHLRSRISIYAYLEQGGRHGWWRSTFRRASCARRETGSPTTDLHRWWRPTPSGSLWPTGRGTWFAAFAPPHRGDRANVDNVPEMVGAQFASVTVDRLSGVFRFPTADPPLVWIKSLRPGTERFVSAWAGR